MTVRILVVDDDGLNLKLVAHALQGEGYELISARDGEQALEQISKQAPKSSCAPG